MKVQVIETLFQLWAAGPSLVSHGLSLVTDQEWREIVRSDAPPTMRVLAPLAIAILLTPALVHWSGTLFRLTIIVMALLVPVWIVLPAE